jgi:hypothetical protein
VIIGISGACDPIPQEYLRHVITKVNVRIDKARKDRPAIGPDHPGILRIGDLALYANSLDASLLDHDDRIVYGRPSPAIDQNPTVQNQRLDLR